MSDKCSHDIRIVNLENGEIVKHQILLVKGKVSSRCSLENEISLRIEDSVKNQLSLQSAKVARSGAFKILVDLPNRSQITFNFSYCNCEQNLCIHHTQASNCYRIQPLYIICQGEKGEFCNKQGSPGSAGAACSLIDLNLLLVQSLFAEKLREHGFGRLSFTLNGKCQIFHSELSCIQAWERTEEELWQAFGKEILNSTLGDDCKLKFIAFIACTKYDGAAVAVLEDFSYLNIRQHLKAHASLGGGGLALFGSGYFYCWPQYFEDILPCFLNDTKIDLTKFPDDSNYRRTHAGVYATSLGSVCHELGHTFDLGHSEDGIMGVGFDYVNRVFTVDTLTEDLPKRHIQKSVFKTLEQLKPIQPQVPRFTKIKKQTDTFMEKYHAQKTGDCFYFARNCAVILAHHVWINESSVEQLSTYEEYVPPTFDAVTQSVICEMKDALKLIEIRCKINSLVTSFYEFPVQENSRPVHCFPLPSSMRDLGSTHYIFVITKSGCTQKLFF